MSRLRYGYTTTEQNQFADVTHGVKDSKWDNICPVCGKPAVSRYRGIKKTTYKHTKKVKKRPITKVEITTPTFNKSTFAYETTYCEEKR